jgi:hypothetical protein
MKERKQEKEKERKKERREKERKIPANCRVDQLLVRYKTLNTLIINIVIVGGDQRKLQVQPEGG